MFQLSRVLQQNIVRERKLQRYKNDLIDLKSYKTICKGKYIYNNSCTNFNIVNSQDKLIMMKKNE